MRIADRLLTIAVTATLTSALWLVAGAGFVERARSVSTAGTADSPASDPAPSDAAPLHTDTASAPSAASIRGLLIPVAGVEAAQLHDSYSDERGGGERLHEAIDIMATRGTPVIAAAGGKIEKLFSSDAGGKTIYVRSPDGRTIHYYAHLDRYAEGIAEGQQVRAGEQIGTVGSTGNASVDAPHLHFAIMQTTPGADWWEPANAINPYPVLKRD